MTSSHLILLTSTNQITGDDGSSEMSESSADTGVDASVIPRPDERDYQREILQLDEESLQTLRDTLAKSVPAPPSTTTTAQPTATTLPTLEETRKRPRDLEPGMSVPFCIGVIWINEKTVWLQCTGPRTSKGWREDSLVPQLYSTLKMSLCKCFTCHFATSIMTMFCSWGDRH